MGHERFPTHRTGGAPGLSAIDTRLPADDGFQGTKVECFVCRDTTMRGIVAQTPRRRFCEAANWEAVGQATSIGACLYTTQVPSAANRHLRRKRGVWPFWNASSLSSLLYFRPEPIRDFRVV